MKCEKCGKEMIKVGELTDEEFQDLCYINNIIDTSNQALDVNTIKGMEFEEGQVFEYFRAVFDSKAKAAYLNYMFWENIMNRLNIHDRDIFVGGDEPDGKELFVHPEE